MTEKLWARRHCLSILRTVLERLERQDPSVFERWARTVPDNHVILFIEIPNHPSQGIMELVAALILRFPALVEMLQAIQEQDRLPTIIFSQVRPILGVLEQILECSVDLTGISGVPCILISADSSTGAVGLDHLLQYLQNPQPNEDN